MLPIGSGECCRALQHLGEKKRGGHVPPRKLPAGEREGGRQSVGRGGSLRTLKDS